MQKTVPSGRALVPFVSVENMARLITSIGLPRLLTELVDYIEQDFRRWQSFEKAPRVASHSEGGVIELMPTSDHVNYVFKYVNGHPVNLQRNLQTVVAFGVLSDVETGYPLLLTEMTLLTALRTAATSAMVARLLAPKDARVLALIGNGAQAEFQAIAMQTICGIEEVRLYDIDPAATAKTRAILRRPASGSPNAKASKRLSLARRSSPPARLTSKMPRSSPITWLVTGCISTRSAATAPARPNWPLPSSPVRMCSSSFRPRPGSRARSSRCPKISR